MSIAVEIPARRGHHPRVQPHYRGLAAANKSKFASCSRIALSRPLLVPRDGDACGSAAAGGPTGAATAGGQAEGADGPTASAGDIAGCGTFIVGPKCSGPGTSSGGCDAPGPGCGCGCRGPGAAGPLSGGGRAEGGSKHDVLSASRPDRSSRLSLQM